MSTTPLPNRARTGRTRSPPPRRSSRSPRCRSPTSTAPRPSTRPRWRLDIDFEPAPARGRVQFTPPGSPASIQFGKGTTTMQTGSLQGLILVVDDIVAARDDLIGRGVEVGEIWHIEPGKGRVPGPRPAAPLVLQPRVVRRSRRQHVGPAGDHGAAPRPGRDAGHREARRAPARDRPIATAPSRRSPRRTTGGTGTRPT